MKVPLAERARPRSLAEVAGQERWLAPGAPLHTAFTQWRFHSMVLWGPPGCGKTTLARLVADASDAVFVALSAVLSGVKDLRAAIETAKANRNLARSTVLFVDEIHRWNKAQQDALLPHLESGLVTLIGATTENPSFSLNSALQSRVQVLRLEPLDTGSLARMLHRVMRDDEILVARDVEVEQGVLERIAESAAGDARRALSDLERALDALPSGEALTNERLADVLARDDLRHDRSGDDHYDVISALIKSMRGSDPNASVYWLARLLSAGEDPRFIARRLVIFAAEDVGNADPRALGVATAAYDAAERIGMPEVRIPLAQATTWLACCPKSNAAYVAINEAMAEVKQTGALPVPNHLKNAPTQLMKSEGLGVDYIYPHDEPHHIAVQQYLPDRLTGRQYYRPAEHAEEKRILDRLAWWQRKLDERE